MEWAVERERRGRQRSRKRLGAVQMRNDPEGESKDQRMRPRKEVQKPLPTGPWDPPTPRTGSGWVSLQVQRPLA